MKLAKNIVIIISLIIPVIFFTSCKNANNIALPTTATVSASEVDEDLDKSENGDDLSSDSSDFVLLSEAVPDAILEIRYYSTYNFVGDRIDGYEEPVALLTKEAAMALKEVSDNLISKGYRLKIYDAYRPQKAVANFVEWAKDTGDIRMKEYFYPELDKSVLFQQGYIAEYSGHSRGSTVDLTLFDMRTEKEVDMGGTFDYFGELSHPDYRQITDDQYNNRMILRDAMVGGGFKPLDTEWWHFTLVNEPFPDTYFTFPVNSDSVNNNDETGYEGEVNETVGDEETNMTIESSEKNDTGNGITEYGKTPLERLSSGAVDSPDWVAGLPQAKDAKQLFIVAAHEKTTAWISMHEKDDSGNWKMIMTTPGFIGKEGLGKTKEGDGKTPTGEFTFNKAFGIEKDPGCAIPYICVDDNMYWSGDDREGMCYNRLVDINDYPGINTDISEHIIDYEYEYRYCLNISYNEEGEAGAGSAIFLHCFGNRRPYTGGCIAIPEEQMNYVMRHVNPDCKVIIDSLDNLGGKFNIS